MRLLSNSPQGSKYNRTFNYSNPDNTMLHTTFFKLTSPAMITALVFGLAACGVFDAASNENPAGNETTVAENPQMAKSGAMLWSENCSRCHAAPPPGSFSDREWEAAMKHMRIRAGLTAGEAERITDFLQIE